MAPQAYVQPEHADTRLMCLATHHKGGTVWMKQVVKGLSALWNVPWIGIWNDRRVKQIPDDGPAFLVNWHGHFPQSLWDRDDARFLHIIRDPRDVLLSGCAYHQHAGPEGEAFLHTPRADLGGLTYQQALVAIVDPTEKLLFEMREKHAQTVAEMRAWPYEDPRSMTIRYEDLMQDVDGQVFRRAMAHWGMDPELQDAANTVFWNNSLFGGLSEAGARAGHVQSGQIGRWGRELPETVAQTYVHEFGDDLISLGYETSHDWIHQVEGHV